MNVPAAIRELEKIEMVRGLDRVYRLDHAVTATQKTILVKLFANSNRTYDEVAAFLKEGMTEEQLAKISPKEKAESRGTEPKNFEWNFFWKLR